VKKATQSIQVRTAREYALVVVLGFVIAWFLVGRSLEPINSVTRTAAGISPGDLSQRIDASDMDSELGQMVAVLNETFAKLESSFDQQVRFTADASHELRTPISVILAKCQFALMRERSPEKYREALKTYTDPGAAYFQVSDTGAGICVENLPHLFDRFYRVNKERSGENKSTGLGLAITKAMIDGHGATVEVDSKLGEGTCFTIRFPC